MTKEEFALNCSVGGSIPYASTLHGSPFQTTAFTSTLASVVLTILGSIDIQNLHMNHLLIPIPVL